MEAQARVDYAHTLPRSRKHAILAAVFLALFLASLDQTVVATALPRILQDLRGLTLLPWLSASYLLASTSMVPVYGRLSDTYGRRRVVIAGIGIFLLGSALCGLASSMWSLICYRALQGLGAAALTSTAFTIIADLFVRAERARYQGLLAGVFALSSLIGPYLGGVLTDSFGWRWVFYINLPVGAAALGLVLDKMPALRSGRLARIDLLGGIVLVLVTVSLLIGITLDKSVYPWSSWPVIASLGVATIGLPVFLRVEWQHPSPMVPVRLFAARHLLLLLLASFLVGAVFISSIMYMSFFATHVMGVDATTAGALLVPMTVSVAVASFAGSMLCQRIGRYKPVAMGALVLLVGACAMLCCIDEHTSAMALRLRMILFGAGIGPTMPVLTLLMQGLVPTAHVGAATAGRQFCQQLGAALGVAALGVVLTSVLADTLGVTSERHAYSLAVSAVYKLNAGLAAMAVLALWAVPDVHARDEEMSEALAESAAS